MSIRPTEDNRRWWVLATMTASLSMILIDQTVVAVALPTIQADLGVTTVGLQWVVNAYLLTLAAFVALGGRIGDLIGNARAFKVGAAIFVLASAVCGFADSEAQIIAARAVQGLGAALLTPATGALVANAFGAEERGRAMGIYAGVSMVFLALGPLIGGLLTDLVSWRAVFFVNLPVGAALLALAHVSLPDTPPRPGRVDWGGVPLIVLSLTCLVLGLMQSRAWGWDSPATIALLVTGAVLLPLTIVWELRQREPLVELRLFRSANFTADGIVLASVQFAMTGIAVLGAVWVQDVLGFTAIEAGLSLLPLTLPVLLIAPRAGGLYDRIGPRGPVTVGCALGALALVWVATVLHHRDYTWLIPGYVVMGIGLGVMMTPANTDAMNAVAPELRAQASAVLQTIRQVGATLGVAVMGTIVAHGQSHRIGELFEHRYGFPPRDVQQIEHAMNGIQSSGETDRGLPEKVMELISPLLDAVTSAVASAFAVAALVLALAAIVAVLLLRHRPAVDAADQVSTSPRSIA
ncbi:DHA2 family efflux MFS transporter permease subunit [Conexibacter stalactiti]|uniref:DHA2 family efflux MFS transporter permease subunit n=1 Tax=Conexibacter stalactiti TaxID=1940611 RepID=A0ABU4HWA0_9ACTN|nr:DHA2 family efflux MFS transporter permease subunit [Conexibacter stalactiti]MDW5597444.1 DHA2 family efflux MFS transporter permease subunit [Conexibacter stalactiti]MEC5038086.1 DHA2 family efflux MFS transporter permease subunit [Conexibacter stalactiti]